MNGEKTFWLPEQASTFTESVDSVFNVYVWTSYIVLAALIFLIVYFGIRYYRKSPDQKAKKQVTHNLKLELAWTIIPTIIFMVFFAWGLVGFMDMNVSPPRPVEVEVVGQKWDWAFNYPNGVVKDTLVVPVEKPVKLIMRSRDVLHSFFIPAFRVKRDVIPNQYTTIWFEATKTGEFHVFCTEFCGTSHSLMKTQARVLPAAEYDAWLTAEAEAQAGLSPVELGEKVYSTNCKACHSIDGTRLVGPSWKGLWGSKREFEDGSSAEVDENYFIKSMEDPNSQVVKTYPPVMTPFKGVFSDKEIAALIAYVKTLK